MNVSGINAISSYQSVTNKNITKRDRINVNNPVESPSFKSLKTVVANSNTTNKLLTKMLTMLASVGIGGSAIAILASYLSKGNKITDLNNDKFGELLKNDTTNNFNITLAKDMAIKDLSSLKQIVGEQEALLHQDELETAINDIKNNEKYSAGDQYGYHSWCVFKKPVLTALGEYKLEHKNDPKKQKLLTNMMDTYKNWTRELDYNNTKLFIEQYMKNPEYVDKMTGFDVKLDENHWAHYREPENFCQFIKDTQNNPEEAKLIEKIKLQNPMLNLQDAKFIAQLDKEKDRQTVLDTIETKKDYILDAKPYWQNLSRVKQLCDDVTNLDFYN